jgi:hypothetical protein
MAQQHLTDSGPHVGVLLVEPLDVAHGQLVGGVEAAHQRVEARALLRRQRSHQFGHEDIG